MKRNMKKLLLALLLTLVGGTAFAVVSTDEFIELCKEGNVEEVKRALADGANVNARDNDGWTALMFAVANGHAKVVEILVRSGADVNASNDSGNTASMVAIISASAPAEILEILVKAGADLDNVPQGGDSTPLTFAAKLGLTETVKTLVKVGADVDARDNNGITALIYAAACGHPEIVKTLVSAGADVNANANGGVTALMYAASNSKNIETLDVLLSCGADVKVRDKNGHNLFWLLSHNENMSDEDKKRCSDKIFEYMRK